MAGASLQRNKAFIMAVIDLAMDLVKLIIIFHDGRAQDKIWILVSALLELAHLLVVDAVSLQINATALCYRIPQRYHLILGPIICQ